MALSRKVTGSIMLILMIFTSGILVALRPEFILRTAHADGLSFETIPPSIVNGKPIGLFIKVEPQILTAETRNNASLQLRLFDAYNNQTIPHVTYFINAFKDTDDLMAFSFHSHSGPLKLNIHPMEGPSAVLNGEKEQTHGAWISKEDDVIDVQSPLLLDSGLYHFQITILGMNDDQNPLGPELAPTFDSWLSVGESFQTRIQYDNADHDLVIISYYDKLNEFRYDPKTYTMFWSMPFDWNPDRIADPNNNIFVHEEVRVPRSLIAYLNSTSFVTTVNDVPISGGGIAVDPYTSETEYIVHYLINKASLAELEQIQNQLMRNSSDMSFTLSINTDEDTEEQTSREFVTTAGIRILTSWEPSQLHSNSESKLNINFSDAQNVNGTGSDAPLNADVRYELKILDKEGNPVIERYDLLAVSGSDSQSMTFPVNDTYQIFVNVTGIERQGQDTDQSRNGIGSGIVVVPEFPLSTITLMLAVGLVGYIIRKTGMGRSSTTKY